MTTPGEGPSSDGPSKTIDERAQAFANEAGAAANRLASHPVVLDAADSASRIWGVVLLVVGLWLVGAITLHLDLPAISWSDLWPLILVALGGLILLRGLARRR